MSKLQYSRKDSSIPWILMLGLLASSSHQQSLDLLTTCKSSARRDFIYLGHFIVEKWCKYIFMFLGINSTQQGTNGLVQDCSNSIANTLELLQSCSKPSIWCWWMVINLIFIKKDEPNPFKISLNQALIIVLNLDTWWYKGTLLNILNS